MILFFFLLFPDLPAGIQPRPDALYPYYSTGYSTGPADSREGGSLRNREYSLFSSHDRSTGHVATGATGYRPIASRRKARGQTFIQKVRENTRVSKNRKQAEYTVPEENMSSISGIGIVLGMLKALEIDSRQFGHSRTGGLALKLVLRKHIRSRVKRLHAGDIFRMRVNNGHTISLSINGQPETVPENRIIEDSETRLKGDLKEGDYLY